MITGVFLFMEVWKDIEGYEGIYQVSNLGRVKGVERLILSEKRENFLVSERLFSLVTSGNGYSTLVLSKNNTVKRFYVHRLVAQAFIPNPKNKRVVNHKNGVKTDNQVGNLEWNTYKENLHHAIRLGLIDSNNEKNNASKLKKEDVLEIRRLFDNKIISQKEISVIFNISKTQVHVIVKRKQWTHI